MQKIQNKKMLLAVISLASTLALLVTLCGCSALSITSSDVNTANNAIYLAQVNTVSKEIQKPLSNFSEYVKAKDVDGMKSSFNEAQTIIDTFTSTEVPADMKKIHSDYTAAFTQLQASLKDYIQVYSDLINNSQTADVLNQRIQTVQNEYNQGISLLNSADKAASEVTK